MNLCGEIIIGDTKYFMYWRDVKNSETITIFSQYHMDDLYKASLYQDVDNYVLSSAFEMSKFCNENYVLESVERLKVSGSVKAYGEPNVAESFINALFFAKNYRFNKKNIYLNEHSMTSGGEELNFFGKDQTLYYKCERSGLFYNKLELKYADIYIRLVPAPFTLKLKWATYTEVAHIKRDNIINKTIKTIDYQMLCDSIDMSWYKDGDTLKKNYQSITNLIDFELKIMTPLTKLIAGKYGTDEQIDVAVDTETSGLFVYNLSKDNEDKDHCVAVPISWAEDSGFVIFTDMEYFNNVPNEYVAKRLGELFQSFKGDHEVKIYERKKADSIGHSGLQRMGLFHESERPSETLSESEGSSVTLSDFEGSSVTLNEDDISNLCATVVIINRKNINLIGHNVMFDKRVFIDLGQYFYFDQDTLQMAFDLNPKTVKGSNKLKVLTRKLFGHETPELTDILGKGNEDKYRYLMVEIVAIIYGCADADYTLKLFHKLKSIMTKRMFIYYQRQDVPLLNILPRSEYYGLNTIEQDVLKLAESTVSDINKLKQYMYSYVGSFVNIYKQRSVLEAKRNAGLLSEDEYSEAVKNVSAKNQLLFEFEFTPTALRHVLFDILKYPIKYWTTGKVPQPKLDKIVMKKLIAIKRNPDDTHFTKLEKDILCSNASEEEYYRLRSSSKESDNKRADNMVLIKADEFNACKYPLALVLQKHSELNKEYTGYYKPILENNLEGKMFKSYSMARIETRRISNPAQTMKGSLKALIRSYSDDYYMCDFDMSQVEYRIMLSLSQHMLMVDRMKDPERDYHTETASLVNNIPAHRVTKKIRKMAKSVSFGVPYSLGERSLCDKIFGTINDETLLMTRMLLAKWEESNRPVMDFLNRERDNALLVRSMSNELRDFMDAWQKDENGDYVTDGLGNKIEKPIGFVYNKLGFYRAFDLSDIDQSEDAKQRRAMGKYDGAEGKIRRPAGNFPIQSYAAELFRIILIRFYNRCEEEGINDKIIWHMLIHDELLCSVHKSIHPFFMYKLIKESCMVTMKGHTSYFVGINIGNTWAETKDDEREAPVYFVDRVIKRWDAGEFGNGPFWFDDPWEELIKDERAKYVDDRIWEVIHEVQPDIDIAPINIPLILQNFDNYTVRAYVDKYATNYDVDASQYSDSEAGDRKWVSKFETWALGRFPVGKPIIDFDGNASVLHKHDKVEVIEDVDDFVDYAELFNDAELVDDYWSFDSVEASDLYDVESVDESDDDTFSYDEGANVTEAFSIADLVQEKKQYKYLNVMQNQVVITVNATLVEDIKKYLTEFVGKDGPSVIFRHKAKTEKWLKLGKKIDYKRLDNKIDELKLNAEISVENSKYRPTRFKCIGNNCMVELCNDSDVNEVLKALAPFGSDKGYSFMLKAPGKGLLKIKTPIWGKFSEIDKALKNLEVILCR